jgi:hypothetical protein
MTVESERIQSVERQDMCETVRKNPEADGSISKPFDKIQKLIGDLFP